MKKINEDFIDRLLDRVVDRLVAAKKKELQGKLSAKQKKSAEDSLKAVEQGAEKFMELIDAVD